MAVAVDDPRVRVTCAAVRITANAVARLVDGFDPRDVLLRDAVEVWQELDRIERLTANAKTLLAVRVEEAGSWKRAGARSAAEHLARLGGTTTRAARRALATSKHVRELPEIAEAMRAGVLSTVQANEVAPAAAADPDAERWLVELAGTTNVTELRVGADYR